MVIQVTWDALVVRCTNDVVTFLFIEDCEGRLPFTIVVVQDPEHQLPDLSFKVIRFSF